MAKYRFRLEALQRLREARRDELRASLAESFRAEQILAESRAELLLETEQLREMQRLATQRQYTDVNQLLEAQRYELLLKARNQKMQKQAILLAAESERRRQLLVESDREVRVLEKLDERHQRAFNREQLRWETKQLDEMAVNGFRNSSEAVL